MNANNSIHSITTIKAIKAFLDNYIWLVSDGLNGVIVDPGDASPVFTYLKKNPLKIKDILIIVN